jgi:GTP diphosphokinase / guanosine-3',5'-bis(diphosphate) 3'-diphosphatase
MATLERAIEIAAAAHAGTKDKAGRPYILHCLRVMMKMETEEQMMAAVLHDVVEDTTVSLAQLAERGFPTAVLEAVDALTKQKRETRIAAARRAKANAIARVVKLADNADNLDLTRIPAPSAKDFKRIGQYAAVRQLLLSDG